MSGPRVLMADMLAHPDDWDSDRYVLRNAKLNVQIWISSGFWFFNWYQFCEPTATVGAWSLFDKACMVVALRKWGALKAQLLVGKSLATCPLCSRIGGPARG